MTLADRETVESNANLILRDADVENVAFLVVGDPFGATTHTDIYLRAIKRGITVQVIHNASIINAVGACGLQLYSYGPIISIPFFTDTWRPDSPYLKVAVNWANGQHTLCLLDIKVKEQSEENLLRGRLIYEPPRFMTVRQAVAQLLESEERHGKGCCKVDTIGVGLMRVGGATQRIIVGTLSELLAADDDIYGEPLHSFVLPGRDLHEIEFEMLKYFALSTSAIKSMTFANFIQSQQ